MDWEICCLSTFYSHEAPCIMVRNGTFCPLSALRSVLWPCSGRCRLRHRTSSISLTVLNIFFFKKGWAWLSPCLSTFLLVSHALLLSPLLSSRLLWSLAVFPILFIVSPTLFSFSILEAWLQLLCWCLVFISGTIWKKKTSKNGVVYREMIYSMLQYIWKDILYGTVYIKHYCNTGFRNSTAIFTVQKSNSWSRNSFGKDH